MGEALGLADGEADGLPLGDVLEDGEVVGDWLGASATIGRAELFGRDAKNRGGRLNVGTSSQNGECGSSAK